VPSSPSRASSRVAAVIMRSRDSDDTSVPPSLADGDLRG
jgi:hypothetical protein